MAFQLALELHRLSLKFPKIEQFALADQIRRASKSICANIAEGYARKLASLLEFKRFLSMAFGSPEEVRVWISFAEKLDYIDTPTATRLTHGYVEIGRMLRALGRAAKKVVPRS